MSGSDHLADALLQLCRQRNVMLAVAESCTGGMIAAALTAVPSSSTAFDRGFVTYSNEAKAEMLGVRTETLQQFGAVSAETACEMAEGVLRHSRAGLALSVTGIAGPGGGSAAKPVGLVWFGVTVTGSVPRAIHHLFPDHGREAIRTAAVETAFRLGIEALSSAQGAAGAP